MYSLVLRNIFNTSTKLGKQKINKSIKLIVPTSLTVPKLLACTSQYSAQNYSSSRESFDKAWSEQDLLKEQLNDGEYESDEMYKVDDAFNPKTRCNPKNPQSYFREKEQAKLDELLKDSEMQRLKKIIELELIVLAQDGECVPTSLNPREWCDILTLQTKAQRKRYYKYVFINEKVDEKIKKKKAERQIELDRVKEERKNAPPSDAIQYGFSQNFMLRRITNTYFNRQHHWNSLKAIMYGNKLVFDCSYSSHMSILESRSCARQLSESYGANRVHNFPFEIFLTNVDRSDMMIETLHRHIPTLFEDDFPFTITDKSYLELFDRSKLCYLTSDAPATLEEYDHETIYIIGAFVDKGSKQPVSLGKAKREGLRMAKLPLDNYLRFGAGGGRDLTLNQVTSIMLDSQRSGWKEAMKHVPTRKLYEYSVRSLENKIKSHMMTEDSNKNRNFDTYDSIQNSYDNIQNSLKETTSDEITDFSHAARAKFREKWNK